MFTGIVEGTGEVIDVERNGDGRRVRVAADLDGLHHGQSIAVSGVCLTVEAFGDGVEPDGSTRRDAESAGGWFDLFLSGETVERTYLGDLEVGDYVNVERALPADGRLDGHVVQGHVDATAEVTGIERVADRADVPDAEYDGDWEFRFSVPAELERYVVEKGSVTVDGISLTVADLSEDFYVAIIPATYELTTLSEKSVGDPVHLEVDVMAKYVEQLLSAGGTNQTPYAERFE